MQSGAIRSCARRRSRGTHNAARAVFFASKVSAVPLRRRRSRSATGTAFFCYVAIEPGAALAVVNAFSPSSTHFELKLRMALLWRLAGGFIAVIQLCGFTMIFGPVLHGLSACRRYGWRHLFGIGRVHRSVDPGVLV